MAFNTKKEISSKRKFQTEFCIETSFAIVPRLSLCILYNARFIRGCQITPAAFCFIADSKARFNESLQTVDYSCPGLPRPTRDYACRRKLQIREQSLPRREISCRLNRVCQEAVIFTRPVTNDISMAATSRFVREVWAATSLCFSSCLPSSYFCEWVPLDIAELQGNDLIHTPRHQIPLDTCSYVCLYTKRIERKYETSKGSLCFPRESDLRCTSDLAEKSRIIA